VPKKSLKNYNKDNTVIKGVDKSEKVKISRKDDKATATLPVGSSDINEVWRMLEERGFSPDDWEIQSLTVNQWEAPSTDGVQLFEQTKATLKQKPKYLGELISSLGSIGSAGFSPQPKLKAKAKQEMLVILGDHQLPFRNEILTELSHSFLNDLRPDGLVYMGDLIDFPNLSHFATNPDFTSTVQQGIDLGHRTLRDLKESAGLKKGSEMIFIEGNHEVRLRKALVEKLPQLFGIKKADVTDDEKSVLHLASLMRFDDLGWTYWDEPSDVYPHPEYEIVKGLFARHGNFVRAKAGMSALANLDRVDGSIIQGHTHRLAITHHSRWTGQKMNLYTAIETGTMADLKGLGYSKQPDWQGGFITLVVDRKTNTFHPELVIFKEDTITWRGYFWTLTNKGVKTNWEKT
jgi:UDP-2,3-diacylglucosamine pyrophosphatase LpxH